MNLMPRQALMSLMLTAAAGLAAAQMPFDETVGYASGMQPQHADCGWEPAMVAAVKAGQPEVPASAPGAAPTGPRLSLQVLELKVTRSRRSNDVWLRVRADVRDNGKLVGSNEFEEEASAPLDQAVCGALKEAAENAGNNAVVWATSRPFMRCGEGCTGITPDEPIVVGKEVLLLAPDAINATVRDDCKFPAAMMERVVKTFNEYSPAPRARMESRAIDVLAYRGRRLVLRVKDMHALGGGGWTGPKWLEMTGELLEGDTVVASFLSRTMSGQGLTTCRSVDSLSDASTYMIVEWLRKPQMGALLK